MKTAVQALNGAVRPVVALAFAGALIFLSIRGDVGAAEFTGLVGFVLGYWFRARDAESKESVIPHG